MSQKIGQLLSYAVNLGDSPADISHLSEDDRFSGGNNQIDQINNYDRNYDPYYSQGSLRYCQKGSKSLSDIMNGKTPREFANEQVYGKKYSQIGQQTTFMIQPQIVRQSSSSQQVATEPTQILTEGQASQNESTQFPKQKSELNPGKTRFTVISEALMNNVLEGKKVIDKRSYTKSQILLSEEGIETLEKQFKQSKLKSGQNHRRQQSQQEKQLVDRLYYDNQAEVRKQQETEEQRMCEMVECTFSPRLISTSRNKNSRHSDGLTKSQDTDFYESLEKMQEKYKMNREHLKDIQDNQIIQSVREKPQIDKNSAIMSQYVFAKKGINQMNVTERLSTLGSQKHSRNNTLITQSLENYSFNPMISNYAGLKQRTSTVQEDLYRDAQKRMNASQCENNNCKSSMYQNSSSTIHSTASQRKNHQEKLFKCFEREFKYAVEYCLKSKLSFDKLFITQNETKEILIHLGFIKDSQSSNEKMIQAIWVQISSSNSSNRVPALNLFVFLLGCQKIIYDGQSIVCQEQYGDEDLIINQQSSRLNQDQQLNQNFYSSTNSNKVQNVVTISLPLSHRDSTAFPVGSFDQSGFLTLNQQQVHKVHNLFKILYDSLLTSQRINRARASRNALPTPSFVPEISEKSSKLAQEKRARIIRDLQSNDKYDGSVLKTNEVLLYQQELAELKKQEIKNKIEDEKMMECTFHPQIKELRGTTKSVSSISGIQKSIELHSMAKPRNQKRDRDRGDVEYEKECDQCTFAPDITKFKNTSKSINSNEGTISTEKTIERVRSGRIQAELKKKLVHKGKTYSQQEREGLQRLVVINLLQDTMKEKQEKTSQQKKPNLPQVNLKNKYQGSVYTNRSNSNTLLYDKDTIHTQEKNNQYRNSMELKENQEEGREIYTGGDSSRVSTLKTDRQIEQDSEEYFLTAPNQLDKDKHSTANSKTIEEERVPLLFVDVNIEDGKTARIIVYEGEKSEDLANKFALEHNLEEAMRLRLKDLLDQQINSLLTKIEEEAGSEHDDEDEEEEENEEEEDSNNENENSESDRDDHEANRFRRRCRQNNKNKKDNIRVDSEEDFINGNKNSTLGAKTLVSDGAIQGEFCALNSERNQLEILHVDQDFRDSDANGNSNLHMQNQLQQSSQPQSSLEMKQFYPISSLGVDYCKNIQSASEFLNNQISSPSFQTNNTQQTSHTYTLLKKSADQGILHQKYGTAQNTQSNAKLTEAQIQDMHLQALAQTFKNFSENPAKFDKELK